MYCISIYLSALFILAGILFIFVSMLLEDWRFIFLTLFCFLVAFILWHVGNYVTSDFYLGGDLSGYIDYQVDQFPDDFRNFFDGFFDGFLDPPAQKQDETVCNCCHCCH